MRVNSYYSYIKIFMDNPGDLEILNDFLHHDIYKKEDFWTLPVLSLFKKKYNIGDVIMQDFFSSFTFSITGNSYGEVFENNSLLYNYEKDIIEAAPLCNIKASDGGGPFTCSDLPQAGFYNGYFLPVLEAFWYYPGQCFIITNL